MVMRHRQPREYTLDKDNRIRDKAGNHVFNAVPITDWDSLKTLFENVKCPGGKHGQNCAMPVPRRDWMATSITTARNVMVWNRYPHSMAARLHPAE